MGRRIESLQKKFTELERSLTTAPASWCTDTDGFLEHSPSRGSLHYKGPALQKIIPGFLGSPLVKFFLIKLIQEAKVC